MELSILIPVFNEENTIKKVVDSVLKQKQVNEVIVINDGSTDKTLNILRQIKVSRLKIITHKNNLGKGSAIRTGFKKITGDFILIQDADLEYNPEEYKKLISISSHKNVVYGSRMKSNNPHAYERTYLGNVLLTSICNLLFGTKLTDSYTCYKLIPAKIAKSLKLKSNGFEIEAEITAKLAKKNVEIIEVPISYNPRSYEQGKKIKAKDAIRGLMTFLRVYLN